MVSKELRKTLEGFIQQHDATIAKLEKQAIRPGSTEEKLLARLRENKEFFKGILG